MYFIWHKHIHSNNWESHSVETKEEAERLIVEYTNDEQVLRVFYGQEINWKPKDVVKTVVLDDVYVDL